MQTELTNLEKCTQIANTLTDRELMELLKDISLRIHEKNKEPELGKAKSSV